MAEGIAKNLLKGNAEIFSAGSKPSGVVDAITIVVMKEIGIDISGNKSKGFKDLPYKEFDYVVTMGCSETCPFVPAKKLIDWQIPNPKGKSIKFYRNVRDEIGEKAANLAAKLNLEE